MEIASREWRGSRRRAAWNTWRELMRERRAVARALSSFRSPSVRRAMLSWVEAAEQSREFHAALGHAVKSLRATGLRRALNTWSLISMRLMGLRRLLGSMKQRGLRAAFNAWEANAEALMAKHELMSRSLRSLHNIPLRFGMNSWSSFAAGRSAQLSALQSAASALRSCTVRAALNSWVEHAVASAESERMLRKAASSLSPRVRSMRRAFNSWSAVWIQLRSLRRGAMALTQSGLRAGFSSWFEFASASASGGERRVS